MRDVCTPGLVSLQRGTTDVSDVILRKNKIKCAMMFEQVIKRMNWGLEIVGGVCGFGDGRDKGKECWMKNHVRDIDMFDMT